MSLLTALPGFADDTASINRDITPAQDTRDYYGDDDPADDAFSSSLTERALIGGISADGSSFVGTVYRGYAKSVYSGFVWTAEEGVQPVGDRDPDAPLNASQYYTAAGISADGKVIVGKAAPGVSGGDFGQRAYRWTAAGGFQLLGSLPGQSNLFSEATAVSGDGKVAVGYVGATGGEAFRWSEEDGMQSLGWLEGRSEAGNDKALAASYDGSVIVGSALSSSSKFQAFHWTEEAGMVALPTLAAYSSSNNTATATGISWDGRIVVGHSLKGYMNQAVRWVDGDIFSLGGLGGASSSLSKAYGISGNGHVIVGEVSGNDSRTNGFRWSEEEGMLTVEDWLRASGATIESNFPGRSEITLTAEATNEDGSVVVGLTRDDKVYIARGTGTGPSGSGTGGGDTGGGETGGGETGGGETGGGETGGGETGGGETGGGETGGGETGGGETGGGNTGGGNTGGGNTGGGNTGGGNTGGGNGGGSGLITLEDLGASIGTSGAAKTSVVNSLGIILNGAGSRPLDHRVPDGKFTMWVGGDWGRDDHGGRDGVLGLGEVGLGYNFGPLQLNGVAGYTGLDQDTILGGTTEVRAGYVKLEALGQITGDQNSGLWGVVTATGLWGKADITRNYLVGGGLIDSSSGRTDVEGYGIRGRLQWENLLPYVSPYGELSYAHTCMGGYTEAGGAFAAGFNKLCDSSTEVRYGIDAKLPITEQLRLIGTLEGVHRFESSGSNVTGQVIGLGGFDLGAAAYQQDWLRAGAGFEVDISGSTLSVMGNATTKGEASNAWVAANWRVTF
ncbi:autotransporter domain-containing protein [Nitratireductor pacificus]|uniref:autotransporter domain-containing protein n=1 Tax=Nitratireductor pacificus TaxID=1231180 RepID=UPI0012F69037|nr:autotransporter domain-containing protein [Nitratireductor pacificus]